MELRVLENQIFFDFINEVGAQMNYFATALPKYTTREKRDDEDKKMNDLIYFDGNMQTRIKSFMQKAEDIRKNTNVFFEYEYPRGESRYGIAKSDIDNALKNMLMFILLLEAVIAYLIYLKPIRDILISI